MAGHNPQKSPSVNNLISFWSDLDATLEESPSPHPSRPRGPHPILSQQRVPPTANVPRSTGPRSQSSPNIPQPSNNPQRYRPAASPSISTLPTASTPSPRPAAPLFPLRSVAPVQTRVFGTQRHALDTLNPRSLASPPAQAPRVIGPRAAHHIRPPPILTSAQSQLTNTTAALPSRPRPPPRQSEKQERVVDPRAMLKKVGNDAGSPTLRRLSLQSERARDSNAAATPQSVSTAFRSQGVPSLATPLSSSPTSALLSRGEGGIVNLALVPPVQSKDDTRIHHHHLARSHPLVSASEPLGSSLDALLPLGKISCDRMVYIPAWDHNSGLKCIPVGLTLVYFYFIFFSQLT